MVYGIMRLINFAHGDIYMLGAYVGFFVTTQLKLGFFPALILAMIAIAAIGVVVEKLAYKPLRHSSKISILITAIGVSLLLNIRLCIFFHPSPVHFRRFFPTRYFIWDR